jgi:hypothetical protein
MNARELIEAAGGVPSVVRMTGLTSSAVYNWGQQNHIPKHWVKYFCLKFPAIRKATLDLAPTYPKKSQISVQNSNRIS